MARCSVLKASSSHGLLSTSSLASGFQENHLRLWHIQMHIYIYILSMHVCVSTHPCKHSVTHLVQICNMIVRDAGLGLCTSNRVMAARQLPSSFQRTPCQ